MIHVFHGFLGSPEDFAFLKGENILVHDLYAMEAPPHISLDDTLIGYSLGGRIALELAHSYLYRLKKIVLISAHPGLASEEERMGRREFEEKVLQEMASKSREDFLSWWNGLPVFAFDKPIITSEERYKMSAKLFREHRLSEQPDFLPEMVKHKDKILYIAGLNDEKYIQLASELLLPHDFHVKSLPGGHRLFQEEKALFELLKTEDIL